VAEDGEEDPGETNVEEDAPDEPPRRATYERRPGLSEKLVTGEEVRHGAVAMVFGLILWGAVLSAASAYLTLPSTVEEHQVYVRDPRRAGDGHRAMGSEEEQAPRRGPPFNGPLAAPNNRDGTGRKRELTREDTHT
jgi:hypothetical protein